MSSIDEAEVAKFSAIAAEWWDPTGTFAPLHKFNPVRLSFIRAEAAAHFGRDPRALRPFEGLRLLDIGCGGGLLSEPMARLGFAVTGADASEKNIGTARAHAAQSGLEIDYRATTAEALVAQSQQFDVVLNMEVVEHVADVGAYLASCTQLVKPGGLTFVATLNKTLKSLALAKIGAEYVLGWLPRGTHDWNRFIAPVDLRTSLEETGLSILKTQGVSFDPLGLGLAAEFGCGRKLHACRAALMAWMKPEEFCEVVRLTPLVSIDLILRDPGGHALVGLRTNEPAKGYWFVPGGRIEKDERLDHAFARILKVETGLEHPLSMSRLLGVYEHFYPTNRYQQPGYGTHYVVIGRELRLDHRPEIAVDDQHSAIAWLAPEEILARADVHENTKAYFR